MTNDLWISILSSSLITGIGTTVIAGIINWKIGVGNYKNEYFKLIIVRRLKAYDELEILINSLKVAVSDNDHKIYHRIFSSDNGWIEIYRLFLDATSSPLWLSGEMYGKTRELNLLFYSASMKKINPIEFGKENYEKISNLRQEIEKIHAKDMLTLHEVQEFLNHKKFRKEKFEPLNIQTK